MNWNRNIRRVHRWGAIIFFIPLALVVGSGLLLQVKKQVPWVQPPTKKGAAPSAIPIQTWEQILATVQSVPEAQIHEWSAIDRLDIRVDRGIAKVLSHNRWEVQVDLATGAVLQAAYRRSDLIESLHDGNFFGEGAKLGLFLPNGIALAILLLTGMYLWYLPIRSRLRKSSRAKFPPQAKPS